MLKKNHVYVDEAGDEGFGKLRETGLSGQSRWFMIGAIVVSAENDRLMPMWRDEVTSAFPRRQNRRDLHFRNLKHPQRVVASRLISEKPLGACVIASNKETILDSEEKEIFKQKQHLYNYLVRFLMERVTDACAAKARQEGHEARLFVTFSRRAGTDYQVMSEYFNFLRDGKEVLQPRRSINWNVFDPKDIRVENHSVRAGLQIADVVTSATYCGLEPNEFGDVEARYALLLKDRYLKERRKVLNCGLTLIPPIGRNPLSEQQKQFIDSLNK